MGVIHGHYNSYTVRGSAGFMLINQSKRPLLRLLFLFSYFALKAWVWYDTGVLWTTTYMCKLLRG